MNLFITSHFDTRQPLPQEHSEDAEEARQQQAAFNSDSALPFLGAWTRLEYQGFDTSSLRTANRFLLLQALVITIDLTRKRIDLYQLDKYSTSRLNTAAWPLNSSAFETTDISTQLILSNLSLLPWPTTHFIPNRKFPIIFWPCIPGLLRSPLHLVHGPSTDMIP